MSRLSSASATLSHAVSGADGYAGIAIASVAVAVTDDDSAGVTVGETDLSLEEGGSATYTVVLDTRPVSDVVIHPVAHGGGLTAAPSELTFTAEDWQTAQTVTVSAAQDEDAADGQGFVTHGILVAPESAYAGVTVAGIVVSVTDDETAGVTVSETGLGLEEGGTATYTVVLDAEPTGDVVIAVSSDNADVTAQPASLTSIARNVASGNARVRSKPRISAPSGPPVGRTSIGANLRIAVMLPPRQPCPMRATGPDPPVLAGRPRHWQAVQEPTTRAHAYARGAAGQEATGDALQVEQARPEPSTHGRPEPAEPRRRALVPDREGQRLPRAPRARMTDQAIRSSIGKDRLKPFVDIRNR